MSNTKLYENYMVNQLSSNIEMSSKRLKIEFHQIDKNVGVYLPKDKHAPILEIGFGTGYMLKYLIAKGYDNVHGIEYSIDAIEYVTKNITKNVTLIDDTDEYLRKNRKKYALIIAFDVVEHIQKQQAVASLTNMREALKTGGALIARVPNAGNPFNTQIFYHDFTHEVFYTTESLRQMLKIVDFNQIDVLPWEEESITLHSKVTNVTAPILFAGMRLLMGLMRAYYSPANHMSRDIYCVCRK